jgi:transcriptional regulator with XRE-family HTH domain
MTKVTTTNLRAVRDRLGLPRERVASKLEPAISSKTLERWEAGETKPKLYRVQQLAELYGVDVSELGCVA